MHGWLHDARVKDVSLIIAVCNDRVVRSGYAVVVRRYPKATKTCFCVFRIPPTSIFKIIVLSCVRPKCVHHRSALRVRLYTCTKPRRRRISNYRGVEVVNGVYFFPHRRRRI